MTSGWRGPTSDLRTTRSHELLLTGPGLLLQEGAVDGLRDLSAVRGIREDQAERRSSRSGDAIFGEVLLELLFGQLKSVEKIEIANTLHTI